MLRPNVVLTVHRPPGTGSFFGRFDPYPASTRGGRKMCLSPCGRGGQSHFRDGKAYSQGPRRLRRENWDSPRERLHAILKLGPRWLALLVMAALSGCHNGPADSSLHDIPPGAIPQPNSTYDCRWIHSEMARAAQDEFVIYLYEWSADPTKLTSSGQQHVARIARLLCQTPYPVVIEPSEDRHLDEQRRTTIVEALAGGGSTVTPDRVVIVKPEAEGLYGLEASGVPRRMLMTQGGVGGTAGGGLGGGMGAGGAQGGFGMSSGMGGSAGIGVGMGSY